MKIKTRFAALLIAVLATGAACGQSPYVSQPEQPDAAETNDPGPPRTSRWLTQTPCLCETPGKSPPIAAEVYVQTGLAFPLTSSAFPRAALSRDMVTGFVVQGGVRTLFFNDTATRAWVIDASLSHVSNGHNQDIKYALRVIDFTGNVDPLTGQDETALLQFGTPTRDGIRVRDTDRTYFNLGLGRDYYVRSSADAPNRHLRFGWDGGGRYGTLSQEYDIIKHRTDVIGGLYVAGHVELEVPSRWGVMQFGVRSEWGYSWADILQRASDIYETNLMISAGLRY